MTGSSIDNPTTMSDYDFLEFQAFVRKVDREDFAYAYENYSPRFESPELQAASADLASVRTLYLEHRHLVDEWWETVGPEKACDLHNAHIAEVDRRRDSACLWGVRYDDGQIVTVSTEAQHGNWLEYMRLNSDRVPVALLHRDEPGGEWTETPPPSAIAL